MKGQIRWNQGRAKYELCANGKTLVASKNHDYLNYLVVKQEHKAVLAAKITEVEIVSYSPSNITITDVQDVTMVPAAPKIEFNINQRFGFLEQLIGMVVNKSAKSMLVSGEGGVGKTHTVLNTLKTAGKIDYMSLVPSIEDIHALDKDDSEEEMEEKVIAQMNQPKGDYVVIKGYSSAKALYRTLYEHRERTIVFDDCDSILKDANAISLLKTALDTYEDRWVAWRIEQAFGESDLPPCFKFQGSIIFISNLPLHKIDEAVRTRCFKVDLSMSKEQRLERMRDVIDNVLPDVDREMKIEALDLLEDNLHLTNDINFRTLMNLIMIRADATVGNWKDLATFALTEQ